MRIAIYGDTKRYDKMGKNYYIEIRYQMIIRTHSLIYRDTDLSISLHLGR